MPRLRYFATRTACLGVLGGCLLSGTGHAAPSVAQEKTTAAPGLLQETAPVAMSEEAAHERFHKGQRKVTDGLVLWGGGLVGVGVGAVGVLVGGVGGNDRLLFGGLALFGVGGVAYLGGPIVGGVGLSQSATALESLGTEVDRTFTRLFWGSYVLQFVPYLNAASAGVPIFLAIERRKHRELYNSLELE